MRVPSIRSWWWEALCFAAYLALTASQLFLRPITGMADNGDFPKVLAPFDLCDPGARDDVLQYVHPRYMLDANCYWDSRLASSETLFVRIIKQLAVWSGSPSIGITDAGAAHLCVMLVSLGVLLWSLRDRAPLFRFAIPPLLILIFSDVLYVSYLNSFYMDAASMVFLLLTASLAVAAILRPRTWLAAGFGIAGVLLALSKTQHVVTGFLFAGLGGWFAVRAFRRGQRLVGSLWTGSAVAILTAAVFTILMTPEDYKAEPLYSLIFYTLIPVSHDRPATLSELGLPANDLPLAGTHAYSPGAPVTTPEWRERFIREISYGSLFRYYLEHPSVPLQVVRHGLTDFAPAMRPGNLANFERQDGFPPGTLSRRFAWWSYARSWLTWVFPLHLVMFFGFMGAGAALCTFRTDWAARWPLYPLALVLAIAGTVEFLIGVLLDATETARHLFFFHVTTELLMICAFAALLEWFHPSPAKGKR